MGAPEGELPTTPTVLDAHITPLGDEDLTTENSFFACIVVSTD